MANEKELTELYSGPGAESFRVFEDENGRVRATMGRGEIVTATPSSGGVENQRGGPVLEAGGFRHSLAENGLPTGAWNIFPHWDLANVITDISAGLTASVDYDVAFAGQPTIRIDIPAGTSGVKKLLGTIGATARIPEGWDLKTCASRLDQQKATRYSQALPCTSAMRRMQTYTPRTRTGQVILTALPGISSQMNGGCGK